MTHFRQDYILVTHNLSFCPFFFNLNCDSDNHFTTTYHPLAATPVKQIELTHHCQQAELFKSAVEIPHLKSLVEINT